MQGPIAAAMKTRTKVVLGSVAALLAGLLLCRHALALRIGIAVANSRSAEREKQLGLKPVFTTAKGWGPVIRTDMDDAWKPLGLKGLNYFVFGAHPSVFSAAPEKTDPSAPRYQAWLGVYVVDLKGAPMPASDAMPALVKSLMLEDQLRWLRTMGDPLPVATLDHASATGMLTVAGRAVPLIEGSLLTHSELSDSEKTMARVVGRPSGWSSEVDAFHPVELEGFVSWFADEPRHALFVVYGCGVKFTRKDGTAVSTWPALRGELLQMARGVQVVPAP